MRKAQKKGIGAIDFFCIGFGSIVGVGWAVSINGWMLNSGGPVPAGVGYLLALVMMIPISLTYCELVPMFPEAGGGMTFAYKAFGRFAALLSGWAAFGAFVAIIPWEAIQVTTVLSYLVPQMPLGPSLYTLYGEEIYPTTILIGAVFSLLIYCLNRKGVSAAAKVQKILCISMLCTAVIAAAAALAGGDINNLQPIYESAGGTHSSLLGGALAMLATAPFFLAGFETIPQCIEAAGGKVTSAGKMVVLSVGLACVFYAVLLFCFGAGLPWKEFCLLDRPVTAAMFRILYPGVVGNLLYWLIVLGSMAGLLSVWNGFFTASANLLMAMGRRKLIPEAFAKQDENGVCRSGLIVCFLLSLTGPFLGIGLINTVTSFSAAAFVLSWMITSFCLVRLRKTMPDAPRPYRIPGGLATGWFASVAASVVFVLLFIPNNPVYMGKTAVMMFLVWMAIGFVLFFLNCRSRSATLKEKSKQN